jgi:hypothetical protein
MLTHTNDIAKIALEKLLLLDFKGKSTEYIVSDVRSWNAITEVLARSVQKDQISYVEFTDQQSLQGMLDAGLPATMAEGYVAMGQALRSGEMQSDFKKNPPSQFGSTKLEDFAKEFVIAFNA